MAIFLCFSAFFMNFFSVVVPNMDIFLYFCASKIDIRPKYCFYTMNNRITHEGVVSHVEGQMITVRFVQRSACADCHAKMLCSGGDAKQRSIVTDSYGLNYAVGEEVTVEVTSQLAWTAMFYAFGLPTLLALIVLFPAIGWLGEMGASLSTLALLLLYYGVLYFFRKKLDRKVVFILHRKV